MHAACVCGMRLEHTGFLRGRWVGQVGTPVKRGLPQGQVPLYAWRMWSPGSKATSMAARVGVFSSSTCTMPTTPYLPDFYQVHDGAAGDRRLQILSSQGLSQGTRWHLHDGELVSCACMLAWVWAAGAQPRCWCHIPACLHVHGSNKDGCADAEASALTRHSAVIACLAFLQPGATEVYDRATRKLVPCDPSRCADTIVRGNQTIHINRAPFTPVSSPPCHGRGAHSSLASVNCDCRS